ncbi:MAG TPA: YqcI/YcgG family protein [Jatrophihabitans sp.]|nr:YqcI/YcgG family protein [Jatrophihabitans sp.]
MTQSSISTRPHDLGEATPADNSPSSLVHPHHTPGAGWQLAAVSAFQERMLADDALFPCIFGVDAVRKGTLRYAFIPAGADRVPALARALAEFTGIAESLGSRTSIVVFFEDDPTLSTMEDYERSFWSYLAELQELDQADWPEGVSKDPADPSWEFSFNGTPLFVVANTPEHKDRRSRHSDFFTVTFQPRFVFNDLKAGTPTGDRARVVIRRRLKDYDRIPQTPLLGSYGDPENREWMQYFLQDHNQPLDPAAACPINHARSV